MCSLIIQALPYMASFLENTLPSGPVYLRWKKKYSFFFLLILILIKPPANIIILT